MRGPRGRVWRSQTVSSTWAQVQCAVSAMQIYASEPQVHHVPRHMARPTATATWHESRRLLLLWRDLYRVVYDG